MTEISTAVKQLEPFVTKESGQVGIKLIKQGQDSHDYLIQLIKSQLGQWIETEWQQIINKLNYLIQDSHQTLNFIPSFSLTNSSVVNEDNSDNEIFSCIISPSK